MYILSCNGFLGYVLKFGEGERKRLVLVRLKMRKMMMRLMVVEFFEIIFFLYFVDFKV